MPDIRVDIGYFNDEQRRFFQGFPNSGDINHIVRDGITITEDEFLAYMMFPWQMDLAGLRNYAELRNQVQNNLGAVNQLLSLNL